MRFRLRTLLISAALLPPILAGILGYFVMLPLRATDEADAARYLVAWIVDNRTIPGFREEYPDAQWIPAKKRFFVVCDFLAPEISLSADPRVHRITAQQYDAVFQKHGYDGTSYITIELKPGSPHEISLDFSIMSGTLGGHGYRFTFRRMLWGLRASGKFLWVS
ncbi:MAG: hypothetical protein SFU86_20920 [Pirellulaceae bacterium]|nr:hypothetical protein [Pirellulaceae bacterium]